MPKMKYFQEIADIRDWYESRIEERNFMTKYQCMPAYNNDDITLKIQALNYLLACQIGFARNKNDAIKPPKEILIKCFSERFAYVKENINLKQYTDLKYKRKRMYEVCEHYLFKLGYDNWYDKLPAELLSYSNE